MKVYVENGGKSSLLFVDTIVSSKYERKLQTRGNESRRNTAWEAIHTQPSS